MLFRQNRLIWPAQFESTLFVKNLFFFNFSFHVLSKFLIFFCFAKFLKTFTTQVHNILQNPQMDVDCCIRENVPWAKLPEDIKILLGNSTREYDKMILEYSIKNQLRYKGNLGKRLCFFLAIIVISSQSDM